MIKRKMFDQTLFSSMLTLILMMGFSVKISPMRKSVFRTIRNLGLYGKNRWNTGLTCYLIKDVSNISPQYYANLTS